MKKIYRIKPSEYRPPAQTRKLTYDTRHIIKILPHTKNACGSGEPNHNLPGCNRLNRSFFFVGSNSSPKCTDIIKKGEIIFTIFFRLFHSFCCLASPILYFFFCKTQIVRFWLGESRARNHLKCGWNWNRNKLRHQNIRVILKPSFSRIFLGKDVLKNYLVFISCGFKYFEDDRNCIFFIMKKDDSSRLKRDWLFGTASQIW